jgi:hypothetical protein
MFISELYIEKFRLFRNNHIKLGKYITAISGFNATGKSTVLGLLSHCGEVKPSKGRPLLHSAFKAELGDILKFSESFDQKIADLGRITFSDHVTPAPPQLLYRAFWQKYSGGLRYRIIPKRTAEWPSSGKIEWPTLYLGLGRLYPLGESLKVDKTNLSAKLSGEDNRYIIDNAKNILSVRQNSNNLTIASISETKKKKAVGFNTDTYDYLSNSAGEDNLGQILITILSFKKLKAKLADNWCGGLLVVDELDAALHPLAQNKLVDFIYRQAEEIGLQVVFTTHSLGLLEYICTKTGHNSPTDINPYELVSLSNANGPLEVVQNPPFDAIYKELMATYCTPTSRKISVFSEDDESRFFIGKLLEEYSVRFKLLDVSFGREQLLKMLVDDFINFSQYIYILDGDVPDEEIGAYAQRIAPAKVGCILKLPGDKRPEQLIWEYLYGLPPDHPFLAWGGRHMGYTKRSIAEAGPFSDKFNGYKKERDKFKMWFRANEQLVNDAYPYWCNDNKQGIERFVRDFIVAYNWIARRSFIPIIRAEFHEGEVGECQRPHLL